LLADVLEAVRSLVPGPGPANDAVAGRIGIPIAVPAHFATAAGISTGIVIGVGIVPAAERRGCNGCRGADGGASNGACGVDRPEARSSSVIRIDLAAGHVPAPIGAIGGGIAGGEILAIGILEEPRAAARIVDCGLREGRCRQRGRDDRGQAKKLQARHGICSMLLRPVLSAPSGSRSAASRMWGHIDVSPPRMCSLRHATSCDPACAAGLCPVNASLAQLAAFEPLSTLAR